MTRKVKMMLALGVIVLFAGGAWGIWHLQPAERRVASQVVGLPNGDFWLRGELMPLAEASREIGLVVGDQEEVRGNVARPGEVIVQRRFGKLRVMADGVALSAEASSDDPGRLHLYGLTMEPLREQKLAPYRFDDDFGRETIGRSDGWEVHGGTWRTLWNESRAADPNQFVAQGESDAESTAMLLAGQDFWNDYSLEVAVQLLDARHAGLIVAWRGEDDYISFSVTGRRASLVLRQGVFEIPLHQKELTMLPANWYRLRVTASSASELRLSVDDHPFGTVKGINAYGRIGLRSAGGAALFDDVKLDSTSAPSLTGTQARSLRAVSAPYSAKPRYEKDERDDHLERWSKDADAWQRAPDGDGWYRYHLPLFQPFKVVEPPDAEVRVVPAGGEASWVEYKPTDRQTITPEIRSAKVWQEFFEQAPADWLAIDGTWEMTNRWQCELRWGFYGGLGTGAVVQYTKRAFHGDQVHEFYYGMKDLYAREHEQRRYVRRDVNVSFMTNGRDLFSGYTFIFGGHDNTGSFLYRGTELVATNAEVKFPPFVHHDDLHLFWRRFRIEAFGGHIRVLHDDLIVFDYHDPDLATAPTGGHVALWTYRNGVVYGRFNSSASQESRSMPAPIPNHNNPHWQPMQPGRVTMDADGWATNHWGGGTFAMQHPLPQPVDLTATPILQLALEIPEGTSVNLHLVVSGQPMIVPLTAPTTGTRRVLGHEFTSAPAWQPYMMEPLTLPIVGGEPSPSIGPDFTLDLLALVHERYPKLESPRLESLIIGNTDLSDYLMAGLSGNRAGARYRAGKPAFK